MKRIAILGCENSHANAFLTFIQKMGEFRDIEVVGVYSDETQAAEKLQEQFSVPVMKHYGDAVGDIDGLIITARHGDSHYTFARPYISGGIPMFIDKPITIGEEQAIAFMEELRDHGVRISGGSSLKQDEYVKRLKDEAAHEIGGKTLGGYVRAPYQRENSYGGFYFYAQHLVEMVCEIFGRSPLSVTARPNGDCIHVLFHYESYDCVGLFCHNSYHYYAARMAETSSKGFEIPSTDDWFYREFSEFYGLLSGEAQAVGYGAFISPVMIMNAIVRSLASGKEEPVRVASL